MKTSQKIIYAQSSDIKSRTYLEYRRDMKKKAIAELEFLPYLQTVLAEKHDDVSLLVRKYGGDAKLWFGRSSRQVTQEPDYQAESSTGDLWLYEFQYAEEIDNLEYVDFKVAKVGKKKRGQPRKPYRDREFFYVVKSKRKYAFITCPWIMKRGELGPVTAWGSRSAYRVQREVFLKQCINGGTELEKTIQIVDDKNCLLDFQHQFLDMENQKFSRQLHDSVDKDTIVKIVPRTLGGFYHVCYLMEKIQKAPDAAGVWLVHLSSFFSRDMSALDFAHFMYSLDFLYFRCSDLSRNERKTLHSVLESAEECIANRINDDGSFATDSRVNSLEETRQIVFSINLLEDLIQDAVVNYGINMSSINGIFQTIPNVKRTANYIRNLS